MWTVKNLFELKNAHDVVIEQNVFENNWEESQPGWAIVLTVRNRAARCTWCTIRNVDFRNNVVRHAGGGVNILGYDDPSRPSVQANNLKIRDNLFYDIDSRWGGAGVLPAAWRRTGERHRRSQHDRSHRRRCWSRSTEVRRPLRARSGFSIHQQSVASRHLWREEHRFRLWHRDDHRVLSSRLVPAAICSPADAASLYPAGNFFAPDFNTIFAGIANADYRLLSAARFAWPAPTAVTWALTWEP